MPNRPSMTTAQKAKAKQLRSKGMTYLKIAAKVGVSESGIFKFLTNRKPSPKKPKLRVVEKPKPKAPLLPPHQFKGSCPIHRRAVHLENLQKLPQLTHAQLIDDLAQAVRNTCAR